MFASLIQELDFPFLKLLNNLYSFKIALTCDNGFISLFSYLDFYCFGKFEFSDFYLLKHLKAIYLLPDFFLTA